MDAETKRAENGSYLSSIFEKYDILIGPTLPISPFDKNKNVPKGWDQRDLFCWTPFTYPFNLTKNPTSTINCGFSESDMPVGMQIVAPMYNDHGCINFAQFLEKIFGLTEKWPDVVI